MVEKSMREKEAAEGFHSAFTKLKSENKELSLQLDFMKKIKIPQLSRQIDEQKEKFKQNERQN